MRVDIENLSFKCIIGLLDVERVKEQRVLIHASFEYEYKENNYIDYAKVALLIEKTMKKQQFFLIEEALLSLKKKLYQKFPLKNLQLKIEKPDILNNCSVGVSI